MSSFVGLVPCEDSTGDGSNRGSITKNGDKKLRSMLIQAAWAAIRVDPELSDSGGGEKACGAYLLCIARAQRISGKANCQGGIRAASVADTKGRDIVLPGKARSITESWFVSGDRDSGTAIRRIQQTDARKSEAPLRSATHSSQSYS